MNLAMVISTLAAMVAAGTVLLLASLGEIVTEKSGILNLGVEGIILVGAVAGVMGVQVSGSLWVAVLVALIAGGLMSLIHAVLTVTFRANQVVSGLALTIFGTGASSLIGAGFVGRTVERLGPIFPAALSEHPVLRLVFGQDILVYLSLALVACVAYFLRRTRAGLIRLGLAEIDDVDDLGAVDAERQRDAEVLVGEHLPHLRILVIHVHVDLALLRRGGDELHQVVVALLLVLRERGLVGERIDLPLLHVDLAGKHVEKQRLDVLVDREGNAVEIGRKRGDFELAGGW